MRYWARPSSRLLHGLASASVLGVNCFLIWRVVRFSRPTCPLLAAICQHTHICQLACPLFLASADTPSQLILSRADVAEFRCGNTAVAQCCSHCLSESTALNVRRSRLQQLLVQGPQRAAPRLQITAEPVPEPPRSCSSAAENGVHSNGGFRGFGLSRQPEEPQASTAAEGSQQPSPGIACAPTLFVPQLLSGIADQCARVRARCWL